jgi:hypothetical protein
MNFFQFFINFVNLYVLHTYTKPLGLLALHSCFRSNHAARSALEILYIYGVGSKEYL